MAFHGTFWALLPPIVAIALALITKEVYSSLFLGILVGGFFYSGFSFEGTLNHIFSEGLIAQYPRSHSGCECTSSPARESREARPARR